MAVDFHYAKNLMLSEKIVYVLSLLKEATIDEVASEIIELDGIATEDGVREITVEIEDQLNKLEKKGEVSIIQFGDLTTKYSLQ